MTVSVVPAPVRHSLNVKAAPERAFAVFTAGMGRWWNPSHSIGASPLKDVVIEPRVGGRWFERGADGAECDWGRLLVWEPPARLVLAWQVDAEWRFDPALVTELELRFLPEGVEATRVELEHRNLERHGAGWEGVRDGIAAGDGWPLYLRRYAELFTN